LGVKLAGNRPVFAKVASEWFQIGAQFTDAIRYLGNKLATNWLTDGTGHSKHCGMGVAGCEVVCFSGISQGDVTLRRVRGHCFISLQRHQMNRFARPISKEEYDRLTASTEPKPSVLSAGLRARAWRENDERLAFDKKMEELCALPQVTEFQ